MQKNWATYNKQHNTWRGAKRCNIVKNLHFALEFPRCLSIPYTHNLKAKESAVCITPYTSIICQELKRENTSYYLFFLFVSFYYINIVYAVMPMITEKKFSSVCWKNSNYKWPYNIRKIIHRLFL